MGKRAILSSMRSLGSAVMAIGIPRVLVALALAAASDTDGFYDTLQGVGVAWRAARRRRALIRAKHRKERRGVKTRVSATPSPKNRAGQICWHTRAGRELLLECSYQRRVIDKMEFLRQSTIHFPDNPARGEEIRQRAYDAGSAQFAEREMLLADFPTAGVN